MPTTRRPGPAIDRHGPVRSCIGCRTRRPARELVRVPRSSSDGVAMVAADGASNGRGAWLCRNEDGAVSPDCADRAIATRQFARAWKTSLDDDDNDAIRRAVGDVRTDE